MKLFNYVRGFFSRSRVCVPLAWRVLNKAMQVSNAYDSRRSMEFSFWKDEDGGVHSILTSSDVPRMIHNSAKAHKRFMKERLDRKNGN